MPSNISLFDKCDLSSAVVELFVREYERHPANPVALDR